MKKNPLLAIVTNPGTAGMIVKRFPTKREALAAGKLLAAKGCRVNGKPVDGVWEIRANPVAGSREGGPALAHHVVIFRKPRRADESAWEEYRRLSGPRAYERAQAQAASLQQSAGRDYVFKTLSYNEDGSWYQGYHGYKPARKMGRENPSSLQAWDLGVVRDGVFFPMARTHSRKKVKAWFNQEVHPKTGEVLAVFERWDDGCSGGSAHTAGGREVPLRARFNPGAAYHKTRYQEERGSREANLGRAAEARRSGAWAAAEDHERAAGVHDYAATREFENMAESSRLEGEAHLGLGAAAQEVGMRANPYEVYGWKYPTARREVKFYKRLDSANRYAEGLVKAGYPKPDVYRLSEQAYRRSVKRNPMLPGAPEVESISVPAGSQQQQKLLASGYRQVGTSGRYAIMKKNPGQDVFKRHQTKIALDTLRMTPQMALVMGGMSIPEAERFLLGEGYSRSRIEAIKAGKQRNPGYRMYALRGPATRDWSGDVQDLPVFSMSESMETLNSRARQRGFRWKPDQSVFGGYWVEPETGDGYLIDDLVAGAAKLARNPMAVHGEMFARWEKYARLLLAEHGKTPSDIKTPIAAWNVAHKLDIPREAYHVGLNDRHIETALKKLFPLAWPARSNPGEAYHRRKAAHAKKSYEFAEERGADYAAERRWSEAQTHLASARASKRAGLRNPGEAYHRRKAAHAKKSYEFAEERGADYAAERRWSEAQTHLASARASRRLGLSNPGGYTLEWRQGPAGTAVSRRYPNDKELFEQMTRLRELGLAYTLYDSAGKVLERRASGKANPGIDPVAGAHMASGRRPGSPVPGSRGSRKCPKCGGAVDTPGVCFRCQHPESRGRARNPAPSDAERAAIMKIKGVQPWMLENPKFIGALKKYIEFHGCWPTSISKRDIKGVGSPQDTDFFVNMGKALDVSYEPTEAQKGSNKFGSAWLHEFNEGGRPTDKAALPDRLCSGDGKTILTHGGKFAVKGWVQK